LMFDTATFCEINNPKRFFWFCSYLAIWMPQL
jgi:hypothetical protein